MSIKNNGLNIDLFKKIENLENGMSFQKYIDYNLVEVGKGYAIASIKIKPKHLNSIQIAHGGLISSLLDGAMGMAAMTYGDNVVTLEMKINYIKSGKLGSRLTAKGIVLHRGKKTIVVEGNISDDEQKLIAHASGTFFVV